MGLPERWSGGRCAALVLDSMRVGGSRRGKAQRGRSVGLRAGSPRIVEVASLI